MFPPYLCVRICFFLVLWPFVIAPVRLSAMLECRKAEEKSSDKQENRDNSNYKKEHIQKRFGTADDTSSVTIIHPYNEDRDMDRDDSDEIQEKPEKSYIDHSHDKVDITENTLFQIVQKAEQDIEDISYYLDLSEEQIKNCTAVPVLVDYKSYLNNRYDYWEKIYQDYRVFLGYKQESLDEERQVWLNAVINKSKQMLTITKFYRKNVQSATGFSGRSETKLPREASNRRIAWGEEWPNYYILQPTTPRVSRAATRSQSFSSAGSEESMRSLFLASQPDYRARAREVIPSYRPPSRERQQTAFDNDALTSSQESLLLKLGRKSLKNKITGSHYNDELTQQYTPQVKTKGFERSLAANTFVDSVPLPWRTRNPVIRPTTKAVSMKKEREESQAWKWERQKYKWRERFPWFFSKERVEEFTPIAPDETET